MKHIYVDSPMVRESKMFSSQRELLDNIINKNEVFIDCSYNSKRSLDVIVVSGLNRFRLNVKHKNFKTLKSKNYNYFTNESVISYHFKTFKSQGLMELQTYIEDGLKSFLPNLSDSFECKYYITNVIKELMKL